MNSAYITNIITPVLQARTELDTRVDTSCSGANIWLHELTGQTCSVALFSASYEPTSDIQVATCLTVYTDEYGRTLILIFHEVLWFGSSMDHSLVNPNQIRINGTPVLDYPFNNNRWFGIHHEDVFVSFTTDGNTVYFNTRVPTDVE